MIPFVWVVSMNDSFFMQFYFDTNGKSRAIFNLDK